MQRTDYRQVRLVIDACGKERGPILFGAFNEMPPMLDQRQRAIQIEYVKWFRGVPPVLKKCEFTDPLPSYRGRLNIAFTGENADLARA